MVRPQIQPIYAVASALLVFILLEAMLVPLAQFARSGSQFGDRAYLYVALTAVTDWVACVVCVFMGMKLTRSKPVLTATYLAMALAVWHLTMIFMLFHFAPALNDATVPYITVYYGGLLITGAVLVLGYERRTLQGTQANRNAVAELAKPSVYGQALTTAGLDSTLTQSLNAKASRLPRVFELTEAEERSASFFDLDLILLEDELLKIKPDRDAYISALRLGIAIEKAMGFVNCRARSFTFAELMRDVCIRLSATVGEEGSWVTLADGFRSYAQDDRLQRRTKIGSYEDILIACQFKNACKASEAEGEQTEDQSGESTDSGTKILAVMK